MNSAVKTDLLVIAASNGENLKLAQRFAEKARELNQTVVLLDLTTIDLPLFTPRTQSQSAPDAVHPLQQQLMGARRWVICAPEYNGSIPPCLTNAIAWLSVQGDDFRHLFNGRPVAMATVSGGGGMELLVSLRIQLTHLGAQVGELNAQGHQQFHAATSGDGGHGHRPAVEQMAEVIALHREPGDGIGEAGRNRAVVFRRADHPAPGAHQLLLQGVNSVRC